MKDERNDFDSPWKEALEKFLHPFLALCFPTLEAQIDWSREVVFLDKELQALEHDAELGRQYVDKLIRVFLRNGTESWILVHVEVQSQPDPQLAERMYQYHHRLKQVHQRSVASLAVLADGDPYYRPDQFEHREFGNRNLFEFSTCKLLDFSSEQLNRPGNPIALVIRAHLAALRSSRESSLRRRRKLELLRHLSRDDFDRETLYQLLRLTDWFLPLSVPQEITLRQELSKLQPEKTMPFVTSFERYARQEGRQEGLKTGIQTGQIEALREAIRDVLLTRFSSIPGGLEERLETCQDAHRLRVWHRMALTVPDSATFLNQLP